jgi:Bacterial PH domain
VVAHQAGGSSGAFLLRVLVPAAGLSALLCLCVWIPYSRAFTECTPAWLRTRGMRGIREYPWPDIAGVAIRKRRGTAAVKITTSHGRCFLLWAPCDRPIAMSDRGFPGKAQRIMGYWQWMAQAPPGDVSERDLQQEAPDAS